MSTPYYPIIQPHPTVRPDTKIEENDVLTELPWLNAILNANSTITLPRGKLISVILI